MLIFSLASYGGSPRPRSGSNLCFRRILSTLTPRFCSNGMGRTAFCHFLSDPAATSCSGSAHSRNRWQINVQLWITDVHRFEFGERFAFDGVYFSSTLRSLGWSSISSGRDGCPKELSRVSTTGHRVHDLLPLRVSFIRPFVSNFMLRPVARRPRCLEYRIVVVAR